MTTRQFGQPVQRREDPRLLTGGGRYLDDLGQDAYEAAFVRSPHAHARIVDIDVTGALDVPGVVAVWTHEDLPGAAGEPLPLLIPHPGISAGRTGYALAKDEVNHVGEAVVMVVATDRYVAEDACDAIRVDYAYLPAVVGVAAARDGDTREAVVGVDALDARRRVQPHAEPTEFVAEAVVGAVETERLRVLEDERDVDVVEASGAPPVVGREEQRLETDARARGVAVGDEEQRPTAAKAIRS